MNKQEYRVSRRLVRDNGSYALVWMSKEDAQVWEQLLDIRHEQDPLQERAATVNYCRLAGIECNIRHTSAC